MDATTHADAVLLRYRGRDVRGRDVEEIREALRRWGTHGRTEVSVRLCEAWHWRQQNGALKSCACRDLLRHLERRGLVRLPPPRRSGAEGRSRQSLAEYPLPLYPLPMEEADLGTLRLRLIDREERLGWRILMDRFHYLGDGTLVGEHLLYVAHLHGDIVACIGWAAAAFRCAARDSYVGWDHELKKRRLALVANNVRFLILPWIRVQHLASKVLAVNLRRLAEDWQRVWGHPVYLAETFVDPSRFAGTCYRASNWRHVGETGGMSRTARGYKRHGRPKAVYVYPLHRRWQQRLTSPE